MAYEIDIDLCYKLPTPYMITDISKSVRKEVMVGSLSELQWQAKLNLNINFQSKVSLFLEKDNTEVTDEKVFKKLEENTVFVAKENTTSSNEPKNKTKTKKVHPSVEEVVLNKCNTSQTWGLKYLTFGGKIYIQEITPGSIAHKSGQLRNGDQILFINGMDMKKLTNQGMYLSILKDKNNNHGVLHLQVLHDSLNREFRTIKIERTSITKPMGLKISGSDRSNKGIFISKIKESKAAYLDSDRQLRVGQRIFKVNEKNLSGATYFECLAAFRATADSYTINLLVFDAFKERNNNNCIFSCIQ